MRLACAYSLCFYVCVTVKYGSSSKLDFCLMFFNNVSISWLAIKRCSWSSLSISTHTTINLKSPKTIENRPKSAENNVKIVKILNKFQCLFYESFSVRTFALTPISPQKFACEAILSEKCIKIIKELLKNPLWSHGIWKDYEKLSSFKQKLKLSSLIIFSFFHSFKIKKNIYCLVEKNSSSNHNSFIIIFFLNNF